MTRARIAATIVEMHDGRPAFLVEIEPNLGLGPLVVDPLGEATEPAGDDLFEDLGYADGPGSE